MTPKYPSAVRELGAFARRVFRGTEMQRATITRDSKEEEEMASKGIVVPMTVTAALHITILCLTYTVIIHGWPKIFGSPAEPTQPEFVTPEEQTWKDLAVR